MTNTEQPAQPDDAPDELAGRIASKLWDYCASVKWGSGKEMMAEREMKKIIKGELAAAPDAQQPPIHSIRCAAWRQPWDEALCNCKAAPDELPRNRSEWREQRIRELEAQLAQYKNCEVAAR